MIGGFLAGYVTVLLVRYIKVPKSIESIKAVLLVPVLSVGISGLIMWFVIGTPITMLLGALEGWLSGLNTENKILLGVITIDIRIETWAARSTSPSLPSR